MQTARLRSAARSATPQQAPPHSRPGSAAAAAAASSAASAAGVRHAGWLWKRFGHGTTSTWRRFWVRGATYVCVLGSVCSELLCSTLCCASSSA